MASPRDVLQQWGSVSQRQFKCLRTLLFKIVRMSQVEWHILLMAVLRGLRQRGRRFKVNLNFTSKFCLKKKKWDGVGAREMVLSYMH